MKGIQQSLAQKQKGKLEDLFSEKSKYKVNKTQGVQVPNNKSLDGQM